MLSYPLHKHSELQHYKKPLKLGDPSPFGTLVVYTVFLQTDAATQSKALTTAKSVFS